MPGNRKPYIGMGMEGRIAAWYAKNTRKDMVEFQNLADRLARDLAVHSHILEVAPGPGYLSIELAKRGQFEVAGLDISKTFVEIARENARRDSVSVDFHLGDASAMPFAGETFDLVVCRAAFKNFSRPQEAIDEMFRVLKLGGRAIIIDLSKNASMKEVDRYIERLGVGCLNSLFMKFTFRYMLMPRAYSESEIESFASRSKFGKIEIVSKPLGFEAVLNK